MSTARDALRAARNKKLRKATEMGIDLEPERQKPGSNARSLAVAAGRMINDSVPRVTEEGLVVDAPPAGAFDGVNTTFVLSDAVRGNNVVVLYGKQGDGTFRVVTRTTNPTPDPLYFFFDLQNPSVIVLGTAPAAVDMIIVVFKKA